MPNLLTATTAAMLAAMLAGATPAAAQDGEFKNVSLADATVTVTLRAAATAGDRVTLGDVCDLDGAAPSLADVQVQTLDSHVRMEDVLAALRSAGVPEHRILFNGPTQCAVFREPAGDEVADDAGEWAIFASISTDEAAATEVPAGEDATLAKRLKMNLSQSLGFPAETLDITLRSTLGFEATQIEPHRVDDLGRVSWRAFAADGRSSMLHAEVTATVEQVVLKQPVRRGQVIRPGDLEKRLLSIESIDERSGEMLDIIGQAAARDLDAGSVVTEEALAPRLLVQRGQRIPVTVSRGGVRVIVFAVSRDDGTYGQTVRAKNEQTGETMTVLVTGHQAGTILD